MTDVKNLLRQAKEDELAGLAKILDANDSTPDVLAERLQRISCSLVKYKVSKSRPSYAQIVEETASNLRIKSLNRQTGVLEREVADRVRKDALRNMTPDQREKVEQQVCPSHKRGTVQKFGKVAAESTGVFAARASGFRVYQLKSELLARVASWMGQTFPFSVYSTSSVIIKKLIGPFGWALIGLQIVLIITGPKWEKVTLAVVAISDIRSRIETERRIEKERQQRERLNQQKRKKLAMIILSAAIVMVALILVFTGADR